ncbi:MAG: DUF308 domain-containing protein [Deltaproteobacteria bacterium]|nr:DUF308 domain-containing protein [Deltaproteobacteria bacterium]
MATKASKKILSAIWWLILLRGIVLVLLGILFLTRPAATLTLVIWFLGAYWFVDGIVTLVKSIKGRKTIKYWGWGIFVGIIGIIAGLLVFSHPVAATLLTTTFLVYFLGFAAMISGISSIVTGISLRKKISNEWSMVFGGVVWFLLGLLLVAHPLVALLVYIYTVGILAIIGGIMLVANAFVIRGIAKGALS